MGLNKGLTFFSLFACWNEADIEQNMSKFTYQERILVAILLEPCFFLMAVKCCVGLREHSVTQSRSGRNCRLHLVADDPGPRCASQWALFTGQWQAVRLGSEVRPFV